jgi:hypothetical protein
MRALDTPAFGAEKYLHEPSRCFLTAYYRG